MPQTEVSNAPKLTNQELKLAIEETRELLCRKTSSQSPIMQPLIKHFECLLLEQAKRASNG